jgi:hypothetical protein
MKKLLALAVLILGLASANAVTVVIDNVIAAHQNNEQRETYTGRLGELVINTNDFGVGLTAFDGEKLGGYPLASGGNPALNFHVEASSDTTALGGKINGTNLYNVVTAIMSNPDYTFSNIPTVTLDTAVYDLPATLVISNSLFLKSVGYKTTHEQTSLAIDAYDLMYGPATIITSTSITNSIDVAFTGSGDRLYIDGLLVSWEITSSSTVGAVFFTDSGFTHEVFSEGNEPELYAYRSIFADAVCEGRTSLNLQFEECFFTDLATGTYSKFTETLNILGPGNTIEYENSMDIPAFGSTVTIKDCKINGTGIFNGSGFVVGTMIFKNVEFYNSDTNWFDGYNGDNYAFIGCTGLPDVITNSTATVSYSTFADGTAIPNQ